MSKSTVTPIARASFPNIAKPDQFNKFSIGLLFPKSDPKVAPFVQWLKKAVQEEALAVAGPNGAAEALSLFTNFKDGDNVGSFKKYRQEYAGHFVLNVGRKTEYGRPCVVNRQKQPIDPTEIYAGCNVLAYIDVYGYKYGSKKSVSVGIQHILKAGENTPFASTGVVVEDAFSGLDLPEEDGTAAPPAAGGVAATPAPAAGPKDPFSGF